MARILSISAFFVLIWITVFPLGARSQALIADLSSHHVAITTGFTGAEVLLFGAVDGAGDVVVIITGPPETVVVRQKQRIAGVWANAADIAFTGVPNFYAIASTRPLEEIATTDIRQLQQIGAENIKFKPARRNGLISNQEFAQFRKALIRNKAAEGLFMTKPASVTLMSNRLFSTRVNFPTNMATGTYTAVVYLFREGSSLQAFSTPILVEKVGFGAEVFKFAHRHSALYGIAAIIVAIFAGWLGSVIFRKV
ncbi:MAG: hypothetical protein CMM47_11280 [Rhodospirillaceae bacterium]|nr:hypothetical protein [Rhodospirillaceae bacterium]